MQILFDFQLTYLYKEEDDHALSKDGDVSIWQDYRAYNSLIQNNHQRDFDELKRTRLRWTSQLSEDE